MNLNIMNSKRLILIFFIVTSQLAFAQTAFWHIEPVYEQLKVLNENLLTVKIGDFYGVITYDGNEVTPCTYSQITSFNEGRALLLNGTRLKGIMNAEGKIVQLINVYNIDPDSPYFSEGLLAVKNSKGFWGYIDEYGEERVEFKYVEAYPFKFGLASVAQKYKSGQKLHMHIDTEGHISALSGGFNDDDLVFTSTFTNSDEGPFAIVVNTNDKISKRALNGTKLSDWVKADVYNSESKIIEFKHGEYRFNKDLSLRSITSSNGKVLKSFDAGPIDDPVYTPSVPSLQSEIGTKGKYDLRVMKKIVLSNQFDSVIPLTQTLCAVSFNEKYGILKIYPTNNLSLNFTNTSNKVSHHVPMIMGLEITNLSSIFKNYSLESAVVTLSSGDEVSSVIDDDGIHFEYLPSFNEEFTETFSVTYQISGLTYPEQQISADFLYSPAFRITWPTENVSLDSSHNAIFDIIVENGASTTSDECEILVEGRSYGKFVFKPNQQISLKITKPIDIQDEDSIARTISVVICENGCPDYKKQQTIVFDRYFIN